ASDPTKRVLELSAVDFLDADFDQDGDVDADDLLLWQAGFGLPAGAAKIDGDANNDGAVNGADFLIWQRQLTGPSAALPTAFAVPEPTGPGVMGLALGCGAWRRRKYHNKGQ
ncbi:MAG TPA: PEP-CTERM sorting domain-containing protein, partial [Lacipirellulaceae bacterium]|nr:PEP-CTERM sorting domain-containing protein [Lacipirellulaceae bacterium]